MITMTRPTSPLEQLGTHFTQVGLPPEQNPGPAGSAAEDQPNAFRPTRGTDLPAPYSILGDGDGVAEEEAHICLRYPTENGVENLSDESMFQTSQESPTDHIFVPSSSLLRSASFKSVVSSLASESIVRPVDGAGTRKRRVSKYQRMLRRDDDGNNCCPPPEREGKDFMDGVYIDGDMPHQRGAHLYLYPSESEALDQYKEGMAHLSHGDLVSAKKCLVCSLRTSLGRERGNGAGTGRLSERISRDDVLGVLASIAASMGNVEEAVKYSFLAMRGLQSSSSSFDFPAGMEKDDKMAGISLRLGDIFFDCGKFHQALKHYKKFLSTHPLSSRRNQPSNNAAIATGKKMERIHKVLAMCALGEGRHRFVQYHHRESLGLQCLLRKAECSYAPSRENVKELAAGASKGDIHLLGRLRSLQQNQKARHSPGTKIFPFGSPQDEEMLNMLKKQDTSKSSPSTTAVSPFYEAMSRLHENKNDIKVALEQCEEMLGQLRQQESSSSSARSSKSSSEEGKLASTYLQMGFLHSRAGSHEQAVYYFRRGFRILRKVVNALPAKDNIADLRRTIALSYLAIGREDMAIQWYRECLRACSRNPGKMADILVSMGIVYGRSGRTAEAMKCFIKSVERSAAVAAKTPSCPDDKDAIAKLLLPSLQELLKSDPFSQTTDVEQDELSDRALDARDVEIVLEFWGFALLRRPRPSQPSSHHSAICRFEMLSLLCCQSGEQAARTGDNEVVFLCSMGNLLFRRGRWEEAVEFYEKCLDLLGSDVDIMSTDAASIDLFELQSNLGKAYLKVGDQDKSTQCCRAAIGHLQRAYDAGSSTVEASSSTPTEIISLIRTMCNDGNDFKGEGEYVPKIISEGDIKSSHVRCFLLCGEGKFDEATSLLHAVIQDAVQTAGRDHPETIHLSYDLCVIYLLYGDTSSASKVYETVQGLGAGAHPRTAGLESPLKQLVAKLIGSNDV